MKTPALTFVEQTDAQIDCAFPITTVFTVEHESLLLSAQRRLALSNRLLYAARIAAVF
jgi:hypothetical protein